MKFELFRPQRRLEQSNPQITYLLTLNDTYKIDNFFHLYVYQHFKSVPSQYLMKSKVIKVSQDALPSFVPKSDFQSDFFMSKII